MLQSPMSRVAKSAAIRASRPIRPLALLGLFVTGACGTNPPGPTLFSSPYGNASQGDVVATASTNIFILVPSGDFEFRNFTVDPGVTLTVPSGTILRCTGTFTVDGSIQVDVGTFGSTSHSSFNGPAGQGNSAAPAGDATPTAIGSGGRGLSSGQAAELLDPGPFGGGAGGSSSASAIGGGGNGGDGGGAFTALAAGALSVAGNIDAGGTAGGVNAGGGAGGIVILASRSSIDVSGVVAARGGKGGDTTISSGHDYVAAGGGGGGGIVNLVSPAITVAGSVLVNPGNGGHGAAEPAVPSTRGGGGGGGACGGDGGHGGVPLNEPFSTGEDGAPGALGQIIADPTDLF